jgi:phosphonate transport system substrate-binding protein
LTKIKEHELEVQTMKHPLILRFASAVLVLALLPCLSFEVRGAEPDDAINLNFGVYTSDKPTDMYRQFKPVLVYLETTMGKHLSKPVKIKLRVFNSYDGARKALVAGELDFVRFGPSSYILAKQENPDISILAVEEYEGSLTFKGVIFVREASGIKKIEDLRGKSFAFGDPDSTIGRYLAQSFLVDKGIYAKDLAKYQYLDRHDRVVAAVLAGTFDAGAAKEGTYLKFKDQGLESLVTFDNVGKPWVAKSGVPAPIREAIAKSLVELKDKKALDAMGEKITAFVEGKDEYYEPVRVGMKKSEEFLRGTNKVEATRPATPAN